MGLETPFMNGGTADQFAGAQVWRRSASTNRENAAVG
jgi:hypothetical protein